MNKFLLPWAFLGLSLSISGQSLGHLRGVTRSLDGHPLPEAQLVVHSVDENTDQTVVSGSDGAFVVENLKAGHYLLTASKEGFKSSEAVAVDLTEGQGLRVDLTLGEGIRAQSGPFMKRLFKAYSDDWHGRTASGPEPKFRGYPTPLTNPPYPFSVWPYGGSPVIGQPDTSVPPLMQALYSGPHGEWWEASRIKVYGWLNGGFDISSSNKTSLGKFANAPAAYYAIPNSANLDQATLYIERVPDTVQKDHFDWGFRLTNLYGLDYRYTTAKGYFSQQLLLKNNTYGYDPVMFYVDLYFPKVADGMNIRIGRYISLPDIEAQLAPNNYTFSHSLTYTYDCYTQTGINATVKLSDHWMVQGGLSPGCEAAPWVNDHKLTVNACFGYTWNNGGDNIYTCANAINDGKYAYNNVNAYYTTYYHKINNNWHTATEYWYQYERKVPNINNPAAASLLQTNANGAVCRSTAELTCFAPDHAVVNYVNRQLSPKDYLSIRNEFFDDQRGQRTGFKTRYTEHLLSWNHWIGSTVLFRPEIRFEHAYDFPAYDNGTKKNQLIFASDVIFFF